MFSEKQINEIEAHGLTVEQVEKQIEAFRQGFPSLEVVKAASPEDGITILTEEACDIAIKHYEATTEQLEVVKFVPASGAATRMFKELFEFVNDDKRGKGIDTLLQNIEKFAFYEELKATGVDFADDKAVVSAIIKAGLNYGAKPKGLVTFHNYPDGARKAIEEHLMEGAQYGASKGVSRLHFTVSPEHKAAFKALLDERVAKYEDKFGIKYDISFSEQKSSTDTIAVNPDNTPFLTDEGKLLFRPAGHGALLSNLNDIEADVIFVKNIDNVTTDALRGDTIRYKKALAGVLLDLQAQTFAHLKALQRKNQISRTSKARSIAVNRKKRTVPHMSFALSIPLLGRINAGMPADSPALAEGEFVVSGKLAELAQNGSLFALKVSGESMRDLGIYAGDIVVVQQLESLPSPGDIVAAVVPGGECTVKSYFPHDQHSIELRPANPDYQVQIHRKDQVQFQGKVVALHRKY